MMTLCLLLTACGGTGGEAGDAADARMPYRNMAGCVMEAEVSCTQDGAAWEATAKALPQLWQEHVIIEMQ